MPVTELEQTYRQYMLLAGVETGLKGLVHWYDCYSDILHSANPANPDAAMRGVWYHTTLVMHADMLFTGKRAGDTQRGAALRALRDASRPDLVALLEKALATPTTGNGRPLGEIIVRVRNAFAHMTYQFEEHGNVFAFLGPQEQEDQRSAMAFVELISTVKKALTEIEGMKLSITADLCFTPGGVQGLLTFIDGARARALRAELRRRKTRQASDT